MDYKLQRYSFLEEDQGCKEYKDDKGDWVKWEDVEPLLKAYLYLINNRNNKNSAERFSITEITVIE
jgi:hypothetical protein